MGVFFDSLSFSNLALIQYPKLNNLAVTWYLFHNCMEWNKLYAAENMCILTCRFSVWNLYFLEFLGTCSLLILLLLWQTCLGGLRDRVANGGDPTKLHEPSAEHNISNANEGISTSILLIGRRTLSMIPKNVEWLFVWMLLISKHIFYVLLCCPSLADWSL